MIESEAKTKWCPQAIASHTDPRQKIEGSKWLHACIGSDCMMWEAQGSSWPVTREDGKVETWRWEPTPASIVSNNVQAVGAPIKNGDCGLKRPPPE